MNYNELVADPLATVRRICVQLDTPLSNVAAERIRQFIPSRSRYRNPRLKAAAAELRTHLDTEARRFEQYCARFSVPR